jgi:prevent-host-death family protein
MTNEVYESVWDALEDTPAEAENMKLRSSLMIAISEAVSAWQVTQTDAAKRLGVTQPRLNDLLRGRVGKFSIDALVALAARAGLAAFGNYDGRIGMAKTIRSSSVRRVPLSEVKDDLSRFLREAEGEEIVITRSGKPAGVLIGFASEDDWLDYQLENDPRFLRRIERARNSLREGRGVRIEDVE